MVAAFELMATDDDLQPCCSKPKHKAKFLRKAMTEAARIRHEASHGWFPGAYLDGVLPAFEECWGFPCRVIREFGPEDSDD
jgi:hypothetical protein